ncbi:RNA-binding protein Raly-like [Drosophila teissieri]|uniref:RNA-binding protein Raly-like n=1 Tax=Drosophila teissieri TaxID=7243 RepID=UPI001CBA5075|nr:RNA-binding protein Raly-like [Drosophila teissieri]
MYSPFSSKENLQSSEEVEDLHVIDTQPGHSVDVPLFSDFSPINPIMEEDSEGVEGGKTSEAKGISVGGGQKGKGDGGGSGGSGGNRLKRNIKHTGSLIVRKLTAGRHNDADKKGAIRKKDKEQQEVADTDKEKPGSKPEGKVAMLRTTTL